MHKDINYIFSRNIKLVGEFKLSVDNETALNDELVDLSKSESRILLLYTTQLEAKIIFEAAKKYSLTGAKYMWLVTQSVVTSDKTILVKLKLDFHGYI